MEVRLGRVEDVGARDTEALSACFKAEALSQGAPLMVCHSSKLSN